MSLFRSWEENSNNERAI